MGIHKGTSGKNFKKRMQESREYYAKKEREARQKRAAFGDPYRNDSARY